MTGRRAVGSILHRAARGAGLDIAGTSLEACRGACNAVSSGSEDSCGAATGLLLFQGSSRRGAPSAAQQQQHVPYNPALGPLRPLRTGAPIASPASVLSSGLLTPTPTPATSFAASSFSTSASHADADVGSLAASHEEDSTTAAAAAVLQRRGPLVDALASCLGLQQLDALLAREENRAAFDEMLFLTALDTAHRLCSSASASAAIQLSNAATQRTYGSSPVPGTSQSLQHKSTVDAATDVLTRLSELLIQLLSEPGALSAEGAVRAVRTLAVLRFNPAGDYAGLQTMAAFYREAVLPSLDPATAPPEIALRAPQLLVDLYFAFSRLFEVAARRERELQAQLAAEALAAEEAAARRQDDDEASSASSSSSTPPWLRAGAAGAAPPGLDGGFGAAGGSAGLVVGDRQLYFELSRMLAGPGVLANMPSKSLGTLSTAMATARFAHYPLAQSIATQTVLRLQAATTGGAVAAHAGMLLPDAAPAGNDAMATSTLSNIISCLSKLGFEHEALCDATANWMLQRLHGSNHLPPHLGGVGFMPMRGFGATGGVGGVEPHHIVDVAVAFARVKYDSLDYLLRAAEVLQLKLPQSSPNSVAMMTWALANSKSGNSPEFEPLLNALSQRMVALYRVGRHASASAGAAAPPAPTKPNYSFPTLPSASDAAAAAAAAVPNGSGPSGANGAAGGGATGGGGGGGMQVVPRHLACMAFAAARMGRLQPLLMDTVAADVVARADKYQARQLCNILRAFTLLDSYRPDMFDAAAAALYDRLAASAATPAAVLAAAPPPAPYVFGPQNYADTAWALALSGHAPLAPELMELLRARVAETASQMGKACVVRAAQAFAVAGGGAGDVAVFEALAQAARPMLVDLGPAYLASLVDAFAEVQHPVSEAFWTACMDAVGLKVPHMERPRPDMQAAAARLAAAFRRHPATAAHPACAQHYVLPLLESLAPPLQQL